ncbi:MAG: hypothetical protein IJ887_13910 [Prevotella sp.]|nr:hypothetical protein [Prevotella sp.]MBR3480703.1 hypothetical protein [Prevotella sp.]
MSLVVKLLCDGEPVDTFEVAAFVDDECRAAAKADNGIYYLMVQGEGSGQPIQLRTYYEGEEVVIDEALVFQKDTNIGLPWDPYIIEIGNNATDGIMSIDSQQLAGDAKYFLLNGVEIDKSQIKNLKSQFYIRYDRSGKVSKLKK